MTSPLPILNRSLSLQQRSLVPDGAGGFEVTWNDLGTVTGAIDARRGTERLIGGRLVPAVAYTITIRAKPSGSPGRPKPDQRLVYGDRIFSILAVAEHDQNGMYLDVWAEEGRSTG